GDGAGDEGDADRLEGGGGKRLGGQAGPEAVPVAGDGDESRDAAIADRVVDLGALRVRGGVVTASAEAGVAGAGPARSHARGQVLRIGAPVERPRGVAPDLPGGARGAQ